jgi:hypothetical protein
VLISDISGEVIPPGAGASIRIDVHSDLGPPIQFDVTMQELLELFAELPLGLNGGDPQVRAPKSAMHRAKERYRRAYEPWPKADDEELAHLFQQRMNVTDIARRFERQPSAVRARPGKLGLN